MSKRTTEPDNDLANQAQTSGPDAAAEAGEPTPDAQIEALSAQLRDKDHEIAELKDKYLRALAEQENARKRIRQQSEESIRVQREALLRDLLPVVDNLELAVAASRTSGNGKSIVEGVEMVLRALHDLLRGHGVTFQQAVGRTFDPQFHEAVDHVEHPDHKPNTVIKEFSRGYQIGERVLRPARVTVSKASSEKRDTSDPEDVENG
jgi:molecular chaperone GrpE